MTPLHPISTRLREARESLNLSVAELHKRARIREHVIDAIDNGRFNELPDVYMRSFLRGYAEHVGVSTKEIDRLIADHFGEFSRDSQKTKKFSFASLFASRSTPKSISEQLPNPRRRILTILFIVFALACLIGLYFQIGRAHV